MADEMISAFVSRNEGVPPQRFRGTFSLESPVAQGCAILFWETGTRREAEDYKMDKKHMGTIRLPIEWTQWNYFNGSFIGMLDLQIHGKLLMENKIKLVLK